MKIHVYVHGWLPHLAAGSERAMQHLLKPLIDSGSEVTVFALQAIGDPYQFEGAWVIPGPPSLDSLSKPDLVLTHHRIGTVFGSLVADHFGIPLVTYLHNERYDIQEMLHCKPDFVLYNTQWVKEVCEPMHSAPGLVIHPPLEPERHQTDKGDKVTLINMSDNKGVDTFYKTAKLLPDVQFLGVQGTHGEQRLDAYANVSIMLTTQDMRNVWAQTALLLMPSGYESYGMCAAEASVSGIPTFAHPTPGLKECLGTAGTFIDREKPEEYAEAIRNYFSNAEYRKKLDKAAVRRGVKLITQSEKELYSWMEWVPTIIASGRPKRQRPEIHLTNATGSKVSCSITLAADMIVWGWSKDLEVV